jgi:hypothetical protein
MRGEISGGFSGGDFQVTNPTELDSLLSDPRAQLHGGCKPEANAPVKTHPFRSECKSFLAALVQVA